MDTIHSNKCDNCGGDLNVSGPGRLKCPYCGSTYNLHAPAQPAAPVANTAATNPFQQINQQAQTSPPANGCFVALIVIIAFVVFVCIIAVLEKSGGGRSNSYADSIASDTNAVSNLLKKMDDVGKTHYKKTNSDSQIVITSSKVHTNKYYTTISITVKNNTDPELLLTSVEFSFRLFDKHGVELRTGDTNTRSTGESLEKDNTHTTEWTITNRVPLAKKIEVTLIKAQFGDTVWDY
jgi:hypothetical protein